MNHDFNETQSETQGETSAPVLSGVKPVLELLEQDPGRIDTLLLRKGQKSHDTDRILDLCRAAGVRFILSDAQGLDRACALAGGGQHTSARHQGTGYQGTGQQETGHQGVVVRLFDAGFTDYEALLAATLNAPLPLLVALDQVQDPGNVGTFARTLYAMGGAGLVIPKHNGAFLGAGARRAAAGALERLPVAKVTNLSRAIDDAEEAGIQIYGASMAPGSINAFTAPLYTPALLVLGSEEHGIRPHVAKRCQTLLHIPMLRNFDSLNVAQAGAILVGCFAAQHAVTQK